MNLVLTRYPYHPDSTEGVLVVEGERFHTIEKPWVPDLDGDPGGAPNQSCVPLGTYRMIRHDTPKHPRTWELLNEALGISTSAKPHMRSECLLHPANKASQLAGCIAPGLTMANWGLDSAVESSTIAFKRIQEIVPWTDDHTLEIKAHA